jgi:SAM-dependent methyltransferase
MERHVYDRMAEIDRDHWWFVGRRRILTALLERWRPGKGPLRILEVGCGTGSNIAMLQQFGTVDAIEPDDDARAFASTRTGVQVKGGYLPDVPLEDGHYDLIVLLDVLEHIPDDKGALAALKPKLAPGGRLMLTVPAMPSLWSAHHVAQHQQRTDKRATLEAVVQAAGFDTLRRTAFNTLLLPAIVGVRWLNRLLGRAGGDEDRIPPRPINGLLTWLFGAERHVAVRGLLPAGVSIALVAEPAGSGMGTDQSGRGPTR